MVCTLPWANLTPKECAKKIKSGYRPEWSGTVNHFPMHFLQLINQCWKEEPSERPSCQTILTLLQDLAKEPDIGHQRFSLLPP